MTVMNVVDGERPFTVEDLEDTPDDGRRYELIDGTLIVSPAPGWPHQQASMALGVLLYYACPRSMRVLTAPFGVRQDRSNEVQPDLVVAWYGDFTDKCLPTAPLLAVEIISPHSRLRDRELKKAFYERWGVPRYWLIDPDRDEPSLTVYARTDAGTYEEKAHVTGADAYDADEPFPVRVVPDELVAGLRP